MSFSENFKSLKVFNEVKTIRTPEKIIEGNKGEVRIFTGNNPKLKLFVKQYKNSNMKISGAVQNMSNFLNEYFSYIIFKAIEPSFKYFKVPKKIGFTFENPGTGQVPDFFGTLRFELITSGAAKGVAFNQAAEDRKDSTHFNNLFKLNFIIPNFIISNFDLHNMNFVGYTGKYKAYQIDPGLAFGGTLGKEGAKTFLRISDINHIMRFLLDEQGEYMKSDEDGLDVIQKNNPKLYKKIMLNFNRWEKFFSGIGAAKILAAIDKAQKAVLERYDALGIDMRKKLVEQFTKIMAVSTPEEVQKMKATMADTLKALNENISELRQFIVRAITMQIKPIVKNNINVLEDYFNSEEFKEKIVGIQQK